MPPAMWGRVSARWAVPAIAHSSDQVAADYARQQLVLLVSWLRLLAAGRAATVAAAVGTARICWASDRVADWIGWRAAAFVAAGSAAVVAAAAALEVAVVGTAAAAGIARGS